MSSDGGLNTGQPPAAPEPTVDSPTNGGQKGGKLQNFLAKLGLAQYTSAFVASGLSPKHIREMSDEDLQQQLGMTKEEVQLLKRGLGGSQAQPVSAQAPPAQPAPMAASAAAPVASAPVQPNRVAASDATPSAGAPVQFAPMTASDAAPVASAAVVGPASAEPAAFSRSASGAPEPLIRPASDAFAASGGAQALHSRGEERPAVAPPAAPGATNVLAVPVAPQPVRADPAVGRPKACGSCGQPQEPGSQFCPFCGAKQVSLDHSTTVSPPTMTIKIRDQHGVDIELNVNPNKPLKVAMTAACARMNIDQAQAYFVFNGGLVHPEATPDRLGLYHGSVIGVGVRVVEKPVKREMMCLDLEFRCPSCLLYGTTSQALLQQETKVRCQHCNWLGETAVWSRRGGAALQKHIKHLQVARSQERENDGDRPMTGYHSTGSKYGTQPGGATRGNQKEIATKIATSGLEIEVDYEGQHIEAPLGGLLALVTQVQKERLAGALLRYFLFCLTFIAMTTMARPVHKIFEVQNTLHRELISEAFPSANSEYKSTIEDIANWGDFWDWMDGVLVEKVFAEHYWRDHTGSAVQRAPYSRFTVGKYNRVISAVQIRQVRVKATLPKCPRDVEGKYPTEFEMACTQESSATTHSCDTPVDNHALSRPCWGSWIAGEQAVEYPDPIQKETAGQSNDPQLPQYNLLCPQNCEAYFIRGYRDVEQWGPFGLTGLADWVIDFDKYRTKQDGLDACKAQCDVSGSAMTGRLSSFQGAGGMPNYCGNDGGKPDLPVIRSGTFEPLGDCWSDVVLLPLDGVEAKRRAAAMRRERWTNEATRGVAVEINTYNPNYDIATATRITIEANPGGLLHTHVEMWSLRLELKETSVDMLRFVLEICFCVWLVYYYLIELSEMYKERLAYLSDAWNYIELANLAIYTYTTVAWLIMCYEYDLRIFKERKSHEYVDLYSIAKEFNIGPTISSFNLIYGFIRFFKYFRLHLRFRILWDTVALAMQTLLPLAALYLFFLLGYTWTGHWLFGHRSRHFHSISEAFLYLAQSTTVGIDYADIKDASPFMAPWWYMSWYFISTACLLALFIAVPSHAFRSVMTHTMMQERAQQEAIAAGAIIPNLLDSWMVIFGKGKAGKQARDDQNELVETLKEVDLEKLWKRLMEGVPLNETAIDAVEMSFLFGGSQRDARHFINRICNLASLERVEVPENPPRTFMQEIEAIEDSLDRFSREVGRVRSHLRKDFKALKQFMSRDSVSGTQALTEGQDKMANLFGLAAQGQLGLQKLMNQSPEPEDGTIFQAKNAGSGKGTKLKAKTRTLQFAGTPGLQRPERGELRMACGVLNRRRKDGNITQGDMLGGQDQNLTDITNRTAISAFCDALPLQRDI